METHTSYYYGNSSTRNGTCMDSPPPPYVGGGDLSFEGVKFSVMGSGRRVVPCQHCRRDLGTFDTLLLHSEGLKKGSVRNEVIFVVNVLERYNATGNYELADARPPLYQIPNSSHFGAEYCRHCNQVDSLTNKPLSCASTRAETSSHDSFSDAEQFSMSLDENTPPTNKCFSKRHHSEQGFQEEQLPRGRHHQNGHIHSPDQHINTSQRRHDYISNSNSKRRKRSSSPKDLVNQKPHSPMTNLSSQSRTEHFLSGNQEYISAAYPGEVSDQSKITLQDNKLKSITTLPYQTGYKCPVVAPQQNDLFLVEADKKLKDKMGRQFRDVLNKKAHTKGPYHDNQWSQDLEALKNDLLKDPKTKNEINRLVEHFIQSWISNHNDKLNIDSLKESDNRVLGRKGDIPPPLKIDTNDDVELNVVCSQESLAERPLIYPEKHGQNEDQFISDKEEFQESTYIPHDDKSYSPTERGIEIRNRRKSSYMIQTPANDSGFFSPSPKIMLNLSPFDHEHDESSSSRRISDDISSNVGSPDVSFAEKWKDSRHTHTNNAESNKGYASDETANNQNNDSNNNNNSSNNNLDYDDDAANVTTSCKSDTENCDFHRNMTCETSSETATVCSTSSAYINDEENNDYDYDIINPAMSPGDGFDPSISPEHWDDFRRSISSNSVDCPTGTGTESPSPDEPFSSHEQFRRRSSGDDSQSTTTSLKKNFTSFEKIENTPVIYQDVTENFSPPRHSYVTASSPDSPKWDSKPIEQANISECGADDPASKDTTTEPVEKQESREPHDSGDIIVAKRLNFDNCSSPPVADKTNSETSPTAEDLQKEPRADDNETSHTDADTCEKVDTEQNEDSSSGVGQDNPIPSSVPQEEKTTRQKKEASVENTQQKKQARRVKINDKRSTDFSYKVVSKERFPLKEPDQESLTTCKARAILQSLETSNKTIGTYTPFELENVRTKNSSQNLLFTGGPFQADQNFRSWLADIVCNKNGQYIVTDWSNCCVQMFSTSGLPGDRVTFTSGPWGLALMNDNIVACTVPHAKQISLLSHGSRLIVVGLVSTIRRYWGIAVAKNQNLVCSCTQGIDLLNPEGKVLRTIQYNEVELEFFVFPQYLTVGDNGVIYVSDSCGTYLIGLPEDGDYSFSFKPLSGIKLRTPRAIEYGRDGFVYIADTDTDKIYRLTEDGVLDSELFNAADNVKGPLAITIRDRKMIVTQKDSSILILPI